MRVNARSGLFMRSGPGIAFPTLKLLPANTIVHAIKVIDGWTQVDLEGDGYADGFVSSVYLIPEETQQEAAPSGEDQEGTDASHIPDLIRTGSSPEGLAEARARASASLPDYPHNGCAAHLSALLQISGIHFPMTWGAGKLAQRLRDRGWKKIPSGMQRAGDVGVCWDNDPDPPGADHVYLVVESDHGDRMLIADNQNPEDAPHVRYASGRGGKTPTEYFLRA